MLSVMLCVIFVLQYLIIVMIFVIGNCIICSELFFISVCGPHTSVFRLSECLLTLTNRLLNLDYYIIDGILFV